MAIKITSIEDAIANNGLKILVHAPAGAGKTVLCATAQAPTLIINAEGGLLSLKGAPDYIKATTVATIADIHELFEMLNKAAEEDKREYDWIMLDSLSEIAEVVLANEKKLTKDPRQAYGELIEQMIKLIKAFRDMPHYNVCMTCKQKRIKDEYTGMQMFQPLMPGSRLGDEVPYLFDEVFALRVEKDDEGKDYRILQTCRDVNFEAKDRSGKLEVFEAPKLHHIYQKVYGES